MNLYDFATNSEPEQKETQYYLDPPAETQQVELFEFVR